MNHKIAIKALGMVSPLGSSLEESLSKYQEGFSVIKESETEGMKGIPVARLSPSARTVVRSLKEDDNRYEALDESVLYAMAASRLAVKEAGWSTGVSAGINIGSSRGATGLFEKYHEEFAKTGKASTLSSPTTTLGNISSWVAHDLRSGGPVISHSITCSTALHAILNAAAWLQSGMATHFLAGGSEASLTPFTLAQMKALKIYSEEVNKTYPCRAGDLQKKRNSMVLGEGAAVAALELYTGGEALAIIEGLGYATERLTHNISISEDARCFQDSMKMALGNIDPEDIDVVVSHTPGTVKGDKAETKAIQAVFGPRTVRVTNNKWLLGHTFGASGALSLEMGIQMLQTGSFFGLPWEARSVIDQGKDIQKVLVNAVGFGGNAVSVILSKAV